MAPRLKFTKEQMITAALDLVRREGTAALTARSLAEALGTSTQPVFTCFGSMDEAKREVKTAAQSLFREYIKNGLDSDIPFFGVGMQYIAFAKDEPQLYRLLFLNGEGGISDAVKELGAIVREPLTRIYSLTAEEADLFFEDCSGDIITDDTLSLLVSMPNVIITSHQAYLTKEALANIAQVTLSNLDEFFASGADTNGKYKNSVTSNQS